MAPAAEQPAAGGDNTHLGPLGHLPTPRSQILTNPVPSATLLAPASISDTITDVSPFIPLVLDLAAHNYYHWRHLFTVHLGRCGLRGHIDLTVPPAMDDPIWVKDDFAILQWLYTRISSELFSLLPKDATAAVVWDELQNLFQDNRDARIQHLETAMRTIRQRDEPVGHYCQRLKAIADELRELGVSVTDRTLITTLLAGITNKFANLRSVIPILRPPPSFAEVRSMLKLEDGQETSTTSQPQLFYSKTHGSGTSGSAPPPPPPAQPPPRPAWQPRHAGVSPNYKGKNPIPGFQHKNASDASSSYTGGNSAPSAPSTSAPASAWRPTTDPWTGLVQAWQVPWQPPAGVGAMSWPTQTGPAPPWLQTTAPHRPTSGPGLLGRPPPQAYASYSPQAPQQQLVPAYQAPMAHPGYQAPATPYQLAPAPPQLSSPYQLPPGQAQHAPSSTAPPPAPPAQWDQASFLQAMNNFTIHGDGGWIVDSGSGHTSSDRSVQ